MAGAAVTVVLCVLVALAAAGPGLYGQGSHVVELTAKNFVQEVLQSDHVWMVEFYAPWCGHCKSLAPEWIKAASNLNGIVKVGAVNCDEEMNKALAGQYEIKGFPTIKFFPSKRTNKPPFKVPEDYQGGRDAAAIVNFATTKLPSFVQPLTSATFEKVFAENTLAKVLLFTDKAATTTLYKGLSVEFKDRLVLLEVKKSDKDLVEKFKVTSFPTLMVLTAADAEPSLYSGKLGADALLTFLKPFAPARTTTQDPSNPTPANPEVHRVKSQADFEKHCLSQPLTCVIAALDETNAEATEIAAQNIVLQGVANKLYKNFAFVVVNGEKQVALQKQFQLYSGFPSVVLYQPKKKVSVNYIGAFDVENIKDFLDSVLIGRKRLYPDNQVPAISNE